MADGSKQDRIAIKTSLYSVIRKRISGFVDCIGTHQSIRVIEAMTKLLRDGIQYFNRLLCYFRADTVTQYYGYILLHVLFYLCASSYFVMSSLMLSRKSMSSYPFSKHVFLYSLMSKCSLSPVPSIVID